VIALVSPLGLVAAAVIALGTYFLKTSGTASQAFGMIKAGLAILVADAKGAFGAISAALAAGDLPAAAAVLWAFLRVEWVKGIAALTRLWNDFAFYVVETWANMVYELAPILVAGLALVQSATDNTATGVLSAWEIAFNGIAVGWSAVSVMMRKDLATLGTLFKAFGATVDLLFDSLLGAFSDFDAMLTKGFNSLGSVFGFDHIPEKPPRKQNRPADRYDRAQDDADQQAAIDAEAANAARFRREQYDANQAGLGQANAARQKEIADATAAQRAALAQAHAAEARGRQAARNGNLDAANKALADAQAAFAAARAAANKLTPLAGGQIKAGAGPGGLGDLDEMAAKGKSAGTFSAAAAARMAGHDPVAARTAKATEKTAKAAEETAEGVEAMIKQGAMAGLAFC
jgi:hypothetical protein